MSGSVWPIFFSKSFIVSGLTFESSVLFYVWCQEVVWFHYFTHSCPVFQHHLLNRQSFLHCPFLRPLSKITCPWVCGFISGLSILSHWSIFLCLCQYHTVLMTVALKYSLKSGRLIPSALFFFLKITLAIGGFLCFHKKS